MQHNLRPENYHPARNARWIRMNSTYKAPPSLRFRDIFATRNRFHRCEIQVIHYLNFEFVFESVNNYRYQGKTQLKCFNFYHPNKM